MGMPGIKNPAFAGYKFYISGENKTMKIGGLQKLSLIDYPGKTAAVIFTQGCNMVCPYCHNPQLVYPHLFEDIFDETQVLIFLKKRQQLLKGAVITGGEPTLQPDLEDFTAKIKELGYAVKLDTNGTNPDILEKLVEKRLVDFIAMDIKAPLQKYGHFYKGAVDCIKKSADIIKACGIAHLFRTTYDSDLLNDSDINEIKAFARPSDFILQECLK